MDHQTFAQLLGNYGEFVGAIGVVVTLVYLTTQIRQNTNAIQSSTYASWNEAAQSWGDFVADNANTLAVFLEKEPDELTPEEYWVAVGFAVKTFNQGQAAFLHHQTGALSDEVLTAHLHGVVSTLERSAVMQRIWRDDLRNALAPSFVEYIEKRATRLSPTNLSPSGSP